MNVAPADQARLLQLFSAVARTSPHAVAVEHHGRLLTYADLETRSNVLGGRLRALGIAPDVVVGLCLGRSLAMVVGALGILKAGGAYLPLDPAYPASRLEFQLRDAGIPVLVTGECLMDRVPAGSWQVIGLGAEGEVKGNAPVEFATPRVTPDHLAYVIYTSGSTGEPKGVEITNGGLDNLVAWHRAAFGVTTRDRAVLQASPGFDAAVWELWPYLATGATVVIADDDTRADPQQFRDWLLGNAITIAFAPTALVESLMQLEWPSPTSLRFLLTGADTLRQYPPPTLPFKVVNNYGPTECTVVTTSGVVQPVTTVERLPSIGHPIANVRIHVLDDELHPVPDGQAGDLYIGGAGLARGYRRRPDLTAERFIPSPFESGARLYKTGDLASRLPDGQLAFLGRTDNQVKVRGFRVELDEVGAALDRHASVAGSVVIAHEDEGEKQLVAYVVPRDEHLTDKELRDFLLQNLPDYMIPALFCRIERLPMNASGKIDRKALPAPADAELLRSEPYVAPRTSTEERVAAMLASLLRVEKVGVNDNFFLLGGNSLLGAQVIARVRDSFEVDLSLLSLFNNPTVAGLGAQIEQLVLAKLGAMSDREAERLLSLRLRTA